MVSYKKMYEKLKNSLSESYETDYICPLCGEIILSDNTEYYCKNEGCSFDKTAGELFFYYAEHNGLERSD